MGIFCRSYYEEQKLQKQQCCFQGKNLYDNYPSCIEMQLGGQITF